MKELSLIFILFLIDMHIISEMICESCVTKHEFLLHYDEYGLKNLPRAPDVQSVEEKDPLSLDDENTGGSTSEEKEETSSYCKKPTNKSLKVCAKFWVDVSKFYIYFYIYIFQILVFILKKSK